MTGHDTAQRDLIDDALDSWALRRGDVIVAVAGHRVRSAGSLNRAIAMARHAGQITNRIRRGTRHQDLVVTVTAQPPDPDQ